jgi:hypothetical protein
MVFCIFVENRIAMAKYSLKINEHTEKGRLLIDFLKTLEGVEIRKEKNNQALNESLKDVKEGRIYKAKDANDLINSCLE